MNNYLAILKEFDGILGAVVGSVATLITTQIIKSMGKLNLYLKKWDVENQRNDECGCVTYERATSLDTKSLYITVILEIYNSCENPKIMRNIKFGFYNGKKEVFAVSPNDKENTIKSQHYSIPKEVTIINIEAKKCIVKEFNFEIDNSSIHLLRDTNNIYLLYTNERNIIKRFLIRRSILD